MKRSLFNILLALAIGACICSCDLDTAPTDMIPEEVALSTVEDAEQLLTGTWKYLMETQSLVRNPGWLTLFLTSDAMGNDVAINPTKYGYNLHYSFNFMNQSNSTSSLHIWTLAYKGIDSYNSIITKIDQLPSHTDRTDDLRKRVKAQALVMRGYLYLNLATFYSFSYQKDPDAPCVPIYLEPSTDRTIEKPRSSVKEVYNRVLADLKDGYDLFESMSKPYEQTSKHKVDKSITAGLLARAYLQMGDGYWDLAAKYANEAQNSATWMSKSEYTDGFNNFENAEWLWGHRQTTDQNGISYNFYYLDVNASYNPYRSFLADPYFKDLFIKEATPLDTIYDTTDIRFSLFEWETKTEGGRLPGSLLYKKFKFRTAYTGDTPLMRKAEMVLIEAECLAEQGLLGSAISKLNELRAARGASTPSLSTLTKDELVEEILTERRKELFGEGFSLSDILRRQKAVVRKAIPTGTMVIVNEKQYPVQGHTITKLPNGEYFTPNSPYYLFAIPLEEITNNPNWN